LKAKVATLSESKTIGGRLTLGFASNIQASTGDLVAVVAGVDSGTVSRPTIGKIKDAWTEMYINMTLGVCRSLVDTHLRVAKHSFAHVHLVHVQDEADLRLRSGDARDGPSLPRRGRSSKVQQHVATLVVGHMRQEIPTELEALGDKTAKTLCTSLERVARLAFGSLGHSNRRQEV